MTEPNWLNEAENRAWRGHLIMSKLLATQLERDLMKDSGLSGADYEVLVHLSEDATHRVRMSELAERMFWSKSRLSHQVARMESRGLVARESCESDARGFFVTLTDAGMGAIRAAAPAHVQSVRAHFLSHLDDAEIDAFGRVSDAVVQHLAVQLGISGPCREAITEGSSCGQDAGGVADEV